MTTVYKIYFKMLASSFVLLGILSFISPARADFGLGGLEYSPVRTFASANGDNFNTYSGTVNFKLNDPTTEISIPFLWSEAKPDVYDAGYDALVADLQWRKFDKPSRSGGYVGVLARAVSARAYGTDSTPLNDKRDVDFGLGVIAGFRRNISSGFYWGANASLVAFGDEPNQDDIGEASLFRQKVSFTFDFLKIGYQFK